MRRENLRLNGKDYAIRLHDDGRIDIDTTWEIPHPSDAGLVHPRMVHRHASVSPYGRLGKQIIASLSPELKAFITGTF
jgi:hypothetical protein